MKEKYIVPPRFIGLMTGVRYAVVNGGLCRIVHEDGIAEEADLGEEPSCETNDDFFDLVRRVQNSRGAKEPSEEIPNHNIHTVVIQADLKHL